MLFSVTLLNSENKELFTKEYDFWMEKDDDSRRRIVDVEDDWIDRMLTDLVNQCLIGEIPSELSREEIFQMVLSFLAPWRLWNTLEICRKTQPSKLLETWKYLRSHQRANNNILGVSDFALSLLSEPATEHASSILADIYKLTLNPWDENQLSLSENAVESFASRVAKVNKHPEFPNFCAWIVGAFVESIKNKEEEESTVGICTLWRMVAQVTCFCESSLEAEFMRCAKMAMDQA
eukprot:TRINITY_DN5084_c0_g3_i4.p2 TRINITY_DN5084_c0_g3~~TRINITY_DN5084_c0_g3_i4.p2  ORF type:complete len:235 (+),score=35.97 TRINITY_DN5084_c0_g3_i4:1231-1935(+)